MRVYDPGRPLYSIHIPKCGGTSFRRALQEWFGERFFTHYFQTADRPPSRVETLPETCVHGHFNRKKGLGLLDYYPDADQVITVLRDPLETAVSNYFFWKNKARDRQLHRGTITVGSEHDYRDIDDFFRKRPLSHIPNFMPAPVTGENVPAVMDRFFLFVGLLEEPEVSLAILARLLGRPLPGLDRENASPRDEELSGELRERFIAENILAYDIYEYGRKMFRALRAEMARS